MQDHNQPEIGRPNRRHLRGSLNAAGIPEASVPNANPNEPRIPEEDGEGQENE
jgi:hypothetical protein